MDPCTSSDDELTMLRRETAQLKRELAKADERLKSAQKSELERRDELLNLQKTWCGQDVGSTGFGNLDLADAYNRSNTERARLELIFLRQKRARRDLQYQTLADSNLRLYTSINELRHMRAQVEDSARIEAYLDRIHAHPSTSSTEPMIAQTGRLFALPPELRLIIYHYAVVAPEPIPLPDTLRCSGGKLVARYSSKIAPTRPKPPSYPPVLLTCRQAHQEALPIYYGSNVFRAESHEDFKTWFRHIGSSNRKMLKDLQCLYGLDGRVIASEHQAAPQVCRYLGLALQWVKNVEQSLGESGMPIEPGILRFVVGLEGRMQWLNGFEIAERMETRDWVEHNKWAQRYKHDRKKAQAAR